MGKELKATVEIYYDKLLRTSEVTVTNRNGVITRGLFYGDVRKEIGECLEKMGFENARGGSNG